MTSTRKIATLLVVTAAVLTASCLWYQAAVLARVDASFTQLDANDDIGDAIRLLGPPHRTAVLSELDHDEYGTRRHKEGKRAKKYLFLVKRFPFTRAFVVGVDKDGHIVTTAEID